MHRFILLLATGLVFLAAGPSGSSSESYKNSWEKIDSLINQASLPRSALQELEKLEARARRDKNRAQVLKALIHKFKVRFMVEEFASDSGFVQMKRTVERELARAKDPSRLDLSTRALLHSMLAEQYWNYYQQNRWTIQNRTASGYRPEDLRTWDLKTLSREIAKHYGASLQDRKALEKTPLQQFAAILNGGSHDSLYRPTLYDFLAHRALEFYTHGEAGLVQPEETFSLNDPKHLADYDTFIQLKFPPADTLSYKYLAMREFQHLLAFHRRGKNKTALVDADLNRLRWVYDQSRMEQKDSLYARALQSLSQKVKGHEVRAEVDHALAQWRLERGRLYRPEAGEAHRWENKKAHEICSQTVKQYPDSRGGKKCLGLLYDLESRQAAFTFESGITPGKPFPASVVFRNLDRLFLRIYPTEDLDGKKLWGGKWDRERIHTLHTNKRDSLLELWAAKKPMKAWEVSLPKTGDYQEHRTEIAMPSLKPGSYLVLASPNKLGKPDSGSRTGGSRRNDSSGFFYGFLEVTPIAYLQRYTEEGLELLVRHRETGESLSKAVAQIWFEEWNKQRNRRDRVKGKRVKADKHGRIVLNPSSKNNKRFRVELIHGKDSLFIHRGFYLSQHRRSHRVDRRTLFFTDRSLYRPGQTVFFKGIAMETEYQSPEKNKVLQNLKTTVELYDVNYQKVSQLELVSNEFGTFSGEFILPNGALNGTFVIRNAYGSKSIQVEEYKRPRFTVSLEDPAKAYKLGEKVELSGEAMALAGFPVADAEVSLTVTRTQYYPYWFSWIFPPPPSTSVVVHRETVQTDAKGRFKVAFQAAPDASADPENKPVFRFEVKASVTDLNGETRQAAKSVSVGFSAMLLSLEIPERMEIQSPSRADSLRLQTTNLSGKEIPAKVQVEVHRLKAPHRVFKKRPWEKPDLHSLKEKEFQKTFPLSVYEHEDQIHTWERGKKVGRYTVDTKKSKSLPLNKKWKPGAYEVTAKGVDAFGVAVEAKAYFTLFDAASSKLPYPQWDWFVPLTPSVEPGDTAELLVGSGLPDVGILWEIEHRGKVAERRLLKVSKSQTRIRIPVPEKYRGNFSVHLSWIKHNRHTTQTHTIAVPWSQKELNVSFKSFRDKLRPGEEEEWQITVSGPGKNKVMAEMAATLYDASLDAFLPHEWNFNIFPAFGARIHWDGGEHFRNASLLSAGRLNGARPRVPALVYPRLNWFGFYWQSHYPVGMMAKSAVPAPRANASGDTDGAPPAAAEPVAEEAMAETADTRVSMRARGKVSQKPKPPSAEPAESKDQTSGKLASELESVKTRSNLNETAFFYPHLKTDNKGNVVITFKLPESLTRWKLLGLVHTADLQSATVTRELVSQKELMVTPNLPRFLRVGDTVVLEAKVTSLVDKPLKGKVQLALRDLLTDENLDQDFANGKPLQEFSLKPRQSRVVRWKLVVPGGANGDSQIGGVIPKIVAKAGKYSDGEESLLPVLKNRMLVTETLPLPLRGKQEKSFELKKLLESEKSKTLRHHRLTLEMTANPAWYAVQALPVMMEFPHDCFEQIFTRYYGNALAGHVVVKQPAIKKVFEAWKNTPGEPALLSALEKNQELKSVLLEETPWVLDARDESQRKKRIALLFDLNKMSQSLATSRLRLSQGQLAGGAWPWFPGMRPNRFVTQHIITGLAHIKALGAMRSEEAKHWKPVIQKAWRYLDAELVDDYKHWKKQFEKKTPAPGPLQVHYLYARSYYPDLPLSRETKAARDYFLKLGKKQWPKLNHYQKGMLALAFHRLTQDKGAAKSLKKSAKETAQAIVKSLREHALISEEMGMYWKENYEGYWHQAPIEAQSLLIEVFGEVAKDSKAVEALKVWLLKSKQTRDWKTTKATADACFALLLQGEEWLSEVKAPEIQVGRQTVDPRKLSEPPEAGTGYFKTIWNAETIEPGMGKVRVKNNNSQPAWGALYWQYFETLDNITPHQSPLKLEKELFREVFTQGGPQLKRLKTGSHQKGEDAKVGDRIVVKLTLRVDRDMEYVHLKDMRAAGLEPEEVLSGYRWQDGLGYYQTTKDAATHFFMDRLPKGTYVLEYSLRAFHAGNFANGVGNLQCMYAPEFASFSQGMRLEISDED